MKTIILGAGRRGVRLAHHLAEEKKDVVIMDASQEEVSQAMNKVDCLGFTGNGTSVDDLKNAGIGNADVFIALTGEDETNLVSCAIASSQFKVPLTIASVRNITYKGNNNLLGISHIINPSMEVASRIYQDIDRGIYSDVIGFEDSNLVMYNVTVEPKSRYINKQVANIRSSVLGHFIIAAVSHDGLAKVPSGETPIQEGDVISFVAKEEAVEQIIKSMGNKRTKPKKITIVGSTEVAFYLLGQFSPAWRKKTTVIARDADKCNLLATSYPDLLVLNRNISSEGIFYQEHLDESDLMICLTDNDELNLLTASYAKSTGVKTTIALINKNPDYLNMTKHLNIDSILSTQDVTVDSVVRHLLGSNVSNAHSLFNGQIETFEVVIQSNSPMCGKKLSEIDIRGKGIIPGVIRNEETIIPNGQFTIKENDKLIFVINRDQADSISSIWNPEEK